MPLKISYICRDQERHILEQVGMPPEEPPCISLGEGELLPALEKHLSQMKPGETRDVVLKPGQAFGMHDDSLLFEVPMEMLELDDPEIGMVVELAEEGEESRPGTIVEMNDDYLLVDCNHPLAGKTLHFTLTLHEKE